MLTDLLKDSDVTKTPYQNKGEVVNLLKSLAMRQLDDLVSEAVYSGYKYSGVGRRPTDVLGKSFSDCADALFDRIDVAKGELCSLDRSAWTKEFVAACEAKRLEMAPLWDVSWRELCDGKRLFQDLQKSVPLNMSLLSFKKRVMLFMRIADPPSENWRSVEGLLKGLLA